MRRWWHAEHDWETTVAEVDLRVGGEVRVVMRNPHDGRRVRRRRPLHRSSTRPTRLAFTWVWDDDTTRAS